MGIGNRFPQQPVAEPYPENVASPYPGMLPPPVRYPRKRRWPLIVGAVLAVLVIAGLAAALIFGRGGDGAQSGALTESSAKAAIQEYLDALTNGDDETVARHTLCGLFDDVKERRSDLALAGLSGDAFRKQYSRADVISIDKMVSWSPNQTQVLFTMKVVPASGSTAYPDERRRSAGDRSATHPGQRNPGLLVPAADRRPVLSAACALLLS